MQGARSLSAHIVSARGDPGMRVKLLGSSKKRTGFHLGCPRQNSSVGRWIQSTRSLSAHILGARGDPSSSASGFVSDRATLIDPEGASILFITPASLKG